MNKRIWLTMAIVLSVAVLLGYGRAVLAALTPEMAANGQSSGSFASGVSSTMVWFSDNLTGDITLLEPVRLTAVIPANVIDGDVTVETTDGTSNPMPFTVGDSSVPDTSGIGSSWVIGFSGAINSDTVWNQNILLIGDVTIAANSTLTVAPGVTVFFAANSDDQSSGLWPDKTEIHVHGKLVAAGTGESPVYFTSNATTPAPEDWGGIIIRRNSTESYIRSCVIQYARFGVAFYVYAETGGNLGGVVSNCLIQENHTGVRKRIFSSGTSTQENISHNLIQNNTTYGVDLATSTGVGTATSQAIVQNNTVTGNGTGIYMYVNSWDGGRADDVSTIRNNTIINNSVYGYYLLAAGGGIRTDAQPLIDNNLFGNNETNIYLFLDRDGGSGSQILWLRPTIQFNTIRAAPKGIAINNSDNVFGTLTPLISHNVFYGFEAGAYALINQTTRAIVAEENYWGDTESDWDVGAPPAWISGTVSVSNHLDSDSPPVVTRITPGKAFAGELLTVHGANFGSGLDVSLAKVVNMASAMPGQSLNYTLTFTNHGPGIAFGTVITDLIPAALVNPTFTSSGAAITPTGSIPFVWQVADLAPGTGGIITVTGVVSPELMSETLIVNTAVISNSFDITATNNMDTAVTQVLIPEINLNPADYVVNEDAGVVTVTAVLSPVQSFLDVMVDYQTLAGTALTGEDYTAVSGTLTFPAGTTTTQFTVPILDDVLVEPTEIFHLALANPVHALMGNVTTGTVTIVDEDGPPLVSLSGDAYLVPEDIGQAMITVTLDHAYLEPVSVEFATSDGTAVADEDYMAVSGTLTLTAGVTQTTFTIPITDDMMVEPNETFTVTLSNPVNATINPTTSAASVTILDNDKPLTEANLIYLPFIARADEASPEPDFPILINKAIAPRPVVMQGEVFFTTTIMIPTDLPATGQFFLSSQPNQLSAISVDDELVLLHDGSEVFTKRFSTDGQTIYPEIVELPRALLTSLAGESITVLYHDVFSENVSATAVWLVYIP